MTRAKKKRTGPNKKIATRIAQTPLANALAALISQIAAQLPNGAAIATQRERDILRKQGNIGRTLVQTVSAHVAADKVGVRTKLDPAVAANTVARITAFWPLIAEMNDVAALLEDSLIRDAAALSVLVSSTATVISASAKGDPTNKDLAHAHKSIVAARKATDPLLPKHSRKTKRAAGAPPVRTPRTHTTTTSSTTSTTTTPAAPAASGPILTMNELTP